MRPRLVREKEPEYFIRLSEEMDEAGPFTLEILREMAESGEILRETWFRLESETEYRRFEEDLPLAADLWPDDEPFDPELEISDPADTAPAEEGEEDELGSTDTRQLLQENVLRDRETRQVGAEPESSVVWTILKEQKWIFVRWILAIGLQIGRASGRE